MKTILLKFIGKETLSFDSIYQNKGFAADAFHFSLIEPQKNDGRKKKWDLTQTIRKVQRVLSRFTYSTILFLLFSFYFIVFGTIKLFTLIKL